MLTWKKQKFHQLTTLELYNILQMRNAIFVVEQKAAFAEIDNKDLHPNTLHISGFNAQNELVAYVRILPKGINYNEVSISRVAISTTARKQGLGVKLMEQALLSCNELFSEEPIKIGAQKRLAKFYQSFGFKQISATYVLDNIDHIDMLLTTKS